jgi:hypothetical protein
MKKSFLIIGIIFLVLGVASLIHPEVKMHAKQREVYVDSQRFIINTQRIIQIPVVMGILLIAAGGTVLFLGARKSVA